jgi:hypothetical protein
MTRDDTIKLAMKAGLLDKVDCSDDYFIPGDALFEEIEAFAKLVAEAEREACAKLCEEIKCGMWEEYKKHRETRFQDACDGAEVCENAIRARGET